MEDTLQDTDLPIDERRRLAAEAKKKKPGTSPSAPAPDYNNMSGADLLKMAYGEDPISSTKNRDNRANSKNATRAYYDREAPVSNSMSRNQQPTDFEMEAKNMAAQADRYYAKTSKGYEPKSLKDSGYNTVDGALAGSNGIVFEKAVYDDEPEPDGFWATMKRNAIAGAGTLQRAYDPNQKFSFLYASTDEDGVPTLREYVGTRAEFAKSGLKTYKMFGMAEEEDGFFESTLKSFHNSAMGIPEMALGVTKATKDAIMIGGKAGSKALGWDTIAERFSKDLAEVDEVDTLYKAMQETSDEQNLIASQASERAGSEDWFGSGIGSVAGSQLAFAGVGGGIRLGLMGVNGVAGVGKLAMGKVLRTAAEGGARKLIGQEALRAAATYGASGVVNFGFAYNEATRAGLSDTEALGFAAAVGSMNSIIETSLVGGKLGNWLTRGKVWGKGGGNQFDDWLANGGGRKMSLDLLDAARAEAARTGGKINEELIENASKGVLKNIWGKLSDRIAPGQMAEEATEEMLQSLTEQGSKLAFNAVYGEDREKNKGKFDQDEISFTEAIKEGFFAAITTGGTKALSGRAKTNLYSYVADGQAEELRVGLDKLVDRGIDLKTRNRVRAEIDMLDMLYQTNQKSFLEVDSKYGKQMKSSLMFLYQTQTQTKSDIEETEKKIAAEMEAIAAQHPAGTPLTPQEEAKLTPLRTRLDNLGKTLKQVNTMIDDFGTEEGRKKVEANFAARDKTLDAKRTQQVTNNLSRYKGSEKDVTKILERVTNDPAGVAVRTVAEAQAALSALADENQADKHNDIQAALVKSLAENPLYLAPELNTEANRDTLLKLGVPLENLPLTDSERGLAEKAWEKFKVSYDAQAAALDNGQPDPGLVQMSPEEQALMDRHVDQDMFDSAVYEAGAERIAALTPEEAAKETLADRAYKNLRYFLQRKGPTVFTATQLHTINTLGTLSEYLSKDQFKAIQSMIFSAEKPVSVILQDVPGMEGKAKGIYDNSTNTLVIQADLYDTKKNKKKREELFQVAVHELTHAQYDQYLLAIHGDWLKTLEGKPHTAESLQFQRFLDLAKLTAMTVGDNARMQDSYIMQVWDDANGIQKDGTRNERRGLLKPSRTENTALLFVREFFAEVQSDRALQTAMIGFKLDDNKNLDKVRHHYNYGRIEKGTSLMGEFFKIMKSFFGAVTKALGSKQRTLLSEAFDMASTLRTNAFEKSGLDLEEHRQFGSQMHEFTISNYNPITLLLKNDLEGITEAIIDGLRYVPEKWQDYTDARIKEMQSRFEDFILETIQPDYTPNTAKAVFFKASASFMLSWKDSAGKTHRQFFNEHAAKVNVNTNVFSDKPSTLSKPQALKTFSNSRLSDENNANSRQILNNLEAAIADDFIGEMWLQYNPDHAFQINGITHYGEVQVMYQTPGGQAMPIGFMHDLTKVRLAGLLHKGATIKMDIERDENRKPIMGKGSSFYVKRDENGQIVDLQALNSMSATPVGYRRESGISPNINLQYRLVLGVDTDAIMEQQRHDRDTLTNQDEDLEVDTDLYDTYDIPATLDEMEESEDDEQRRLAEALGIDLSEYNLDEIDSRTAQERTKIGAKIGMHEVRRAAYLLNITNPKLLKAGLKAKLAKQSELLQGLFPEEQNIALFGHPTEEAYEEWISTYVDDMLGGTGSNRHESADYEGHGKNPTKTISTKIKVDVESMTYTDTDSVERTIDWADAEQMLFESASVSSDFAGMMEYLKAEYGLSKNYSANTAAIAMAIYTKWTTPVKESEAKFLQHRDKSIYSQMHSLVRTAMHTLIRGEAGGVKMEANGKSQDYKDKVARYKSAVSERVALFREQNPGLSGEELYKKFLSELGTTETFDPGVPVSRRQLGSVFGALSSLKSRLTSNTPNQQAAIEKAKPDSKKNDKYLTIPIDSITPSDYKRLIKQVDALLRHLGIDDAPVVLMERERIRQRSTDEKKATAKKKIVAAYRNKIDAYAKAMKKTPGREELIAAYRKGQLVAYHQEVAEMEHRLDMMEQVFAYHQVEFGRKSNETKAFKFGQYGPHTGVEFYLQLADFLMLEVEKDFKGGDFDYGITEVKELAKKVLERAGSYESPRMFTDAKGNNRYSYKIKSYLDSLLQAFNLDTDGAGIIGDYLRNDIYRKNPILAQMVDKKSPFRPSFVGGLVGQDGKAVDYADANEMDFLYTHLGSFLSGGKSHYHHVDDVPSDKPTIMNYVLKRIFPGEYKSQMQRIIDTEQVRLQVAEQKFNNSFEPVGDGTYYAASKADYFDLVPDVHYKAVVDEDGNQKELHGMPLWEKGWIFDTKQYFYGGEQEASKIVKAMEKEAEERYHYYVKRGLDVPLEDAFVADNDPDVQLAKLRRDKAKADKQKENGQAKANNLPEMIRKAEQNLVENRKKYADLKEQEQKKTFIAWTVNNTVNRYWMSQLLMGDYMFYKQYTKQGNDEFFADLNKRKAGPAAPRQVGKYDRETANVTLMKTLDKGETPFGLSRIVQNADGTFSVADDELVVTSDRTDAQGYIKDSFAQETQEAFGDFSNFGAPFKPVLFGVNRHHLEEARPTYYKLSLTVVPRPGTKEGDEFYLRQPEFLEFATKFYASDSDMAIFDSAVKVGISGVNEITDEAYTSQPFDLNLFGLQNNPKHDIDADNRLNGLVQMEKILADMGNFGAMVEYYAISSRFLQGKANKLFRDTWGTPEKRLDWVKKKLRAQDHTSELADALDMGMILENPSVSSMVQNLINAEIRTTMAAMQKPGDKLVNQSDYGMQRAELSPSAIASLKERGHAFAATISKELRWAGPRKIGELTFRQRSLLQERIDANKGETKGILDDNDYVLDANGQMQVYGADMLVPATPTGTKPVYAIGDQIISVRIPTSSPSSIIPGEVVGLLPVEMGNVIITPGAGPGLLGFDFDVDGLFTWRKGQMDESPEADAMFDIAYKVLTHPKNFNNMTVAVSTKDLDRLATDIQSSLKALNTGEDARPETNKFSPFNQIEKKELNSIGKQMISIFAYHYGVHSVMNQIGAKLVPSVIESKYGDFVTNARAYNMSGNAGSGRSFPETYIEPSGKKRSVYEAFMQLLNAATDNAKLQLLGRLGIDGETSSILVDMIAHGFPIEHALYFINQPIIREYSEAAALQKSASFGGDKEDVYEQLFEKYEKKIAKARGLAKFDYYEESNGVTLRRDAIYKKERRVINKKGETEVLESKIDRKSVTLDELKGALRAPSALGGEGAGNREEFQLAILEKFKYYKSLSNVTSGAAQLVGMASNFPKTYLEAVNRKYKIDEVLGTWSEAKGWQGQKISIGALVTTEDHKFDGESYHPQYVHLYNGLGRTIDMYRDILVYATPAVYASHVQMAGGKPIEVQNRVMRDFYTWVLTQHPALQTNTFNGEELEAYDFVHVTAEVIAEAKNALPDNAFLRQLEVKHSPGTNAQREDRSTDPSYVTFFGTAEGRSLEKIHEHWDLLPEDFVYQPKGAKIGQTVNLKTALLGHLAHTRGFALGAGFGTILPNHVRLSLDATISEYSDKVRAASDPKFFGKRVMDSMDETDFYALVAAGENLKKQIEEQEEAYDFAFQQAMEAGADAEAVAMPEFAEYLKKIPNLPVEMHRYFKHGFPQNGDDFAIYSPGEYDEESEQAAYLTLLEMAAKSPAVHDWLVDNAEMDTDALHEAIQLARTRNADLDLVSFRTQALLHNPELIPSTTLGEWKKARGAKGMAESPSSIPGEYVKNFGAVVYTFNAKNEVVEVKVMADKENPAPDGIIFKALQNRLIKIPNKATGKEDIYEMVEGHEGMVRLQPSTFKANKRVKQYKRRHRITERAVPVAPTQQEDDMQAYTSKGIVFRGKNHLDMTQFGKFRERPVMMDEKHDPRGKKPFSFLLTSEGITTAYQAVAMGYKTAMTAYRPLKYKVGELFKIASSENPEEMIIARVANRPPYKVQAMVDRMKFTDADQRFAELEGLTATIESAVFDKRVFDERTRQYKDVNKIVKHPGALEMNPNLLNHTQVQFEYVATVKPDGFIIHKSDKFGVADEAVDLSAYDNTGRVAPYSVAAAQELLGTGKVKTYVRAQKEGASFFKSLKGASSGIVDMIRVYLNHNKIEKATPAEIAYGLMTKDFPVEVITSEEAPAAVITQPGGVNYEEHTILAGGQPLVRFRSDEKYDAAIHDVENPQGQPERRVLGVFRANVEAGNVEFKALLNQGGNMNAFVLKSILHDSAVKGYKNVLFPMAAAPELKTVRPVKTVKDAAGNQWAQMQTVIENDVDLSYYNPQDRYNQDYHGKDATVQNEEQMLMYLHFPTLAKGFIDGTVSLHDYVQTGIINPATGQPYTYGEFIYMKLAEYQVSKARLIEIHDLINSRPDFFDTTVTSDKALADLQIEITRFGSMEKKMFGRVYAEIGNAMGDRMVAQQLKTLKMFNAGIDDQAVLKQQEDINSWQLIGQSVSDFGAGQLAIQRMSRKISATNIMFEAEKNEKTAQLQALMKNVSVKYYAHYPDNKKMFTWKQVMQLNKPFNWLFEKDANGELTGKFLQRYETVYQNGQPVPVQTRVFDNIVATANGTGSKAELAKANLALYEFLMKTGNGLMKDLGFDQQVMEERAFMPMTSMDTMETWERSGLFAAYLKAFGPEINEKFDSIVVDYNGQRKTVEEWVEYYSNSGQSLGEKYRAPQHLKKIMDLASKAAINGTSGLSAEELRHVVMDFNTSSELPFRSIARKKKFSQNVPRMLTQHISNLTFKKHHDPLVPMMHALKTHYQYKNDNSQKAFGNVINFIDQYSDRYLFNQKDQYSEGAMGQVLERLGATTAIMYMGANPIRAALNLSTGLYFSAQGKLAASMDPDKGFILSAKDGWNKIAVGYKRMTADREKSIAILSLYRVEMFSDLDIEREANLLGKAEDLVMKLQQQSELMVRGTSFLSELSQEQWDNFQMKVNPVTGKKELHSIDPTLQPTSTKVKEWLYYINSQQGNYSAEGRRNYHRNSFLKTAALFKGWVIDFFQERFRVSWIDQYGKEREGYVRGVWNMLWNYKQVMEDYKRRGNKLSKLQMEHIVKIAMDVAVIGALQLLKVPFDDEEPGEKYFRDKVGKLQAEVYFWMDMKGWLEMAKNPLAIIGPFEHLLGAMMGLAAMDMEKAGKHGFALLPGHSIVRDVYDLSVAFAKEGEEIAKEAAQ